jgi:hypothetical protein
MPSCHVPAQATNAVPGGVKAKGYGATNIAGRTGDQNIHVWNGLKARLVNFNHIAVWVLQEHLIPACNGPLAVVGIAYA